MNHHSPSKISPGASSYFAAAGSWSDDIHGALRRSRNLAWVIATVAAAIAMLQAVALICLMPLKTVVPLPLLVDRQTGYVQTVRALQPGALSQNAAVTQSNLVQYVLARETFDLTDLQRDYHRTVLFSVGKVREDYLRAVRASNPASPLRVYPRTAQIRVIIKSISLLSPRAALVRFDTLRTDGGPSSERRAYASVIGFRYSRKSLSMSERFENPLGFEVTSYRRDPEAIPPTAQVHPGGIE